MAQARIETLLTLRRGESLLVTLIIPTGLFLFFALAPTFNEDRARPDTFLPGALAIAVMATAMTSLGIATGFERYYKILKRLATTPLGRFRLIIAKIIAVLVVESLQMLVLLLTGALLGVSAPQRLTAMVIGAMLGTAAFAGLGLAMAGSLKPEINLALNNAILIGFVLLGGALLPSLGRAAELLPLAPLAQVMDWGLVGGAAPRESLITLTAWAAATPLLATLTFSWE